MCVVCVFCTHAWSSEENSIELVLFLHLPLGSRLKPGLLGKCLDLLCYLTDSGLLSELYTTKRHTQYLAFVQDWLFNFLWTFNRLCGRQGKWHAEMSTGIPWQHQGVIIMVCGFRQTWFKCELQCFLDVRHLGSHLTFPNLSFLYYIARVAIVLIFKGGACEGAGSLVNSG